MFLKVQHVQKLNGGGGVVFMTGTPITDTMAEMFTMQRYLQMDVLQKKRLQHFDSWAATFGETVTAMELAPDGAGYRLNTRFARFVNVPELMHLFRQMGKHHICWMTVSADIDDVKARGDLQRDCAQRQVRMDQLKPLHEAGHFSRHVLRVRCSERRIRVEVQAQTDVAGEQLELAIEELRRSARVEGKRLRVESFEAANLRVLRVARHHRALRVGEIPPEEIVAEIVIRPEEDLVRHSALDERLHGQGTHSGTRSGWPPERSIMSGRFSSFRKRSTSSPGVFQSEYSSFADKRSNGT